MVRCSSCGNCWCCRRCSEEDAKLHQTECALLRCLPRAVAMCKRYPSVQYHDLAIMLRGLAVRVADPVRWSKLLDFEDHHDVAKAEDSRFRSWSAAARVVFELVSSAGVPGVGQATERDALRVLLLSHVNAVAGLATGLGGAKQANPPLAIYPVFARLEHSCVPNIVFHNVEEGALQVVAKTRVAVKPGESLSISYAMLDEPVHRRQALLLRDKYFRCACARCSAESAEHEEPGAICALRCRATKRCEGIVKPTGGDYYLTSEAWHCATCGCKGLELPEVEALEETMLAALDDADTVEKCDALLRRFGDRLSPDHFVRVLCVAQRADLAMRPLERLILGGRAREASPEAVEDVLNSYERVVLPWAERHLPRRILQLRQSWCTMFYRLGQARLALAAQRGGVQRLTEALAAYEASLAEAELCLGDAFAEPLRGFVANLRSKVPRVRA
eukprot:TRINITY_DN32729_c0_g1_i1.p1 TRINITY_DN32729_c0_g1~~TRINITY_DN32729_c0_g1_i1.p1  ORF type:complete len:472 (-),score=92.02 TRINITY_DN32729_c0_g1_i1:155-1492(-)